MPPSLLSFKFKRVYSELNSFVGKEKASASEVEPPHLVQSLNYDYTSFQRLENRWHTFCCALCPQQLRESRAVQEMADPEHPLLSREKQAPCNLVESGTKPRWDIPNTRGLCNAFWIFKFLFTFFFFFKENNSHPPHPKHTHPPIALSGNLFVWREECLLTILAKLLITCHLSN